MIYGIGCDLCQIDRIKKSLEGAHGEAFAQRVYGPLEQQRLQLPVQNGAITAHRAASAAADFAAKEAFLKAAKLGISGGIALAEVQAVRLPGGAPEYRFTGAAARWMEERGLVAHLSQSHDGGVAMAYCVLETR